MYLLTQELPKDKIEDYENTLSLLSFQLKLREMDIVKEAADNLSRLISLSTIYSKSKKYLLNEIEFFKGQSKYSIQIPDNNPNEVEEILGSTRDKEVDETIKS